MVAAIDRFSLSPLLRGEGRGEGPPPQIPNIDARGDSPSPGLLRNPTSPRKRGEVSRTRTPIQLNTFMLWISRTSW